MATSIHSSLSCLLPFYTIPIFPLFKSFIYLYNLYTSMYTKTLILVKRDFYIIQALLFLLVIVLFA